MVRRGHAGPAGGSPAHAFTDRAGRQTLRFSPAPIARWRASAFLKVRIA